jgi:5-methylcytosine-specific restriction endonuclease McrA
MTYDPNAGKKLRDKVVKIAGRVSAYESEAHLEFIANVVQCYVRDPEDRKQLYDTLLDAIYRYLFSGAKGALESGLSRKKGQHEIDRFIRRHTALTEKSDISSLREALMKAVSNSKADPISTKQRRSFKEKRRRDNCYLCGAMIRSDEMESLDHRWPRNAGGGSGENILRVHADCEAPKHDLAFPADAPVFRLAFSSPPDALCTPIGKWWPQNIGNKKDMIAYVEKYRTSTLRIAILRRQDYRCLRCGEDFRTVGPIMIRRREITAPWWYANLIAVCQPCDRKLKEAAT